MYTVLKFHWKPEEFARMSVQQKAFVIACIDEKVKQEKEALAKIKRK